MAKQRVRYLASLAHLARNLVTKTLPRAQASINIFTRVSLLLQINLHYHSSLVAFHTYYYIISTNIQTRNGNPDHSFKAGMTPSPQPRAFETSLLIPSIIGLIWH